ncbi:hypothetical protein RUM43_011368 [Polyplax serrata]|uniref:Uncharacterized protein n=1 Tax=Polyplax serrata TaxID=468196 RepID=A0AAN8S3M8_POLSC
MPKAMIQWLPTGLPDSNVQYHCLITFSCQDGSPSVRDQSQQRHCSCSVTDNLVLLFLPKNETKSKRKLQMRCCETDLASVQVGDVTRPLYIS